MNRDQEFITNWQLMPAGLKRNLKDLERYEAKQVRERNACYCVGYLAALEHCFVVTGELFTYCLALIGCISRGELFACEAVRYAQL